MSGELEIISDGEGLGVIGNLTDVERFFLDHGLDRLPSRRLDLPRLSSVTGTTGAALEVGASIAANSGQWVKLTKESADLMKTVGLMATKTPGVSHAMIGTPGDIKKWIQIVQTPTSTLLGGPMAITAISTMMQQQALQQQMDEIVEYLQEISEKVEDILRAQKDSVLAEMIGVDLVIEDALTVRDHVGRVSEITWSKVQTADMSLARTQAYSIRQLDAIAEKLAKKADLGEIARATKTAEPQVREWLAVIARCFQLQNAVALLELDRVLDVDPGDLESHRLGLATARQKRLDLISRSTARLLEQMDQTVRTANSKVLLNPFDSPAAVRSSNEITEGVLVFRDRLGIESGHESGDAKRWSKAAGEAVDKAIAAGTGSAAAAKRLGERTFERASEPFREVDVDGDGIADRPRAAVAAEQTGAVIKGAAAGLADAVGSRLRRRAWAASDNESQAADDGGDGGGA